MNVLKSSGEKEVTLHFIKDHIAQKYPHQRKSMQTQHFKNALQKIIDKGLVEKSGTHRVRLIEQESKSDASDNGTQENVQRKLIAYLKKEKRGTRQRIAKEVGLDTATCSAILSELEKDGTISREGKHTFCFEKHSQKKRGRENVDRERAGKNLKALVNGVFTNLEATMDSLKMLAHEMLSRM